MARSESELQQAQRAVNNELTGADDLISSYNERGLSPSQELADRRNRLAGMRARFGQSQELPTDIREAVQAFEGFQEAQLYLDGRASEVSSYVRNLRGERFE